ncbi:MAG TPA: septum site-determining protein MinC [Bacilli bacterium]
MSTAKHHVTIKGVKDGLVFLLDDNCTFAELLSELKDKLETTHHQILTGPLISVTVKLGERKLSAEEETLIRNTIGRRGNLLIKSLEAGSRAGKSAPSFKVIKGMIRSGQTVHHEGNLLLIGDVNPGGTISCTGDIYVMGSLRGIAHAGANGNAQAVIAASHLHPTQLRIAHIISRPPDEWESGEMFMEFAYLEDDKMNIDKLSQLHRIRPGNMEW